MKVLLVPWMCSAYGPFATLVFPGSAEEFEKQNMLNTESVLITRRNRHKIVIALLNQYPVKVVKVDPFNTGKNTRIGVEVEIPEEDVQRLLRALKIEDLENYLAVKALIED